MKSHELFMMRHRNVYAIPILHYTMEMAAQVKMAFQKIQPDCVAVELPETMHLQFLHAASRLPDISIVTSESEKNEAHYYLCEPCDGAFEALRSALEYQIPAYCIDFDIENYPSFRDQLPDPYAIQHIGLKAYYTSYAEQLKKNPNHPQDHERELYMARRLKELSLQFETVFFVSGFHHLQNILNLIDLNAFPDQIPFPRKPAQVCTLTEESCRDIMAECGWFSSAYENMRASYEKEEALGNEATSFFSPNRQHLIYQLYKKSSEQYKENEGPFAGYHMRNLMKFSRNYAWIKGNLMPNLYQILSSAKACVDHNYAYETWKLATFYPYRKNIDNLPELNLSIEEVWGNSKLLHFHLKQKPRKSTYMQSRKKDLPHIKFTPPSPFSICSYPPEDIVVERFGDFLKKKGPLLLSEEASRTLPFTSSLEDGIDIRETIRHFFENKLYVKVRGKPPGNAGSIVVIFDEDQPNDEKKGEKYPWKVTWIGEHNQESDMSFYATSLAQNVVGPGISRCEYGGFMMSSPPRRMFDVWQDPDYSDCLSKAEILLTAAIDYSVKPIVVYVAKKPPRSKIKSFASRFGKKIVYIPIGQLSPITLNKLRVFHVLDGHDKREIAGDYIF